MTGSEARRPSLPSFHRRYHVGGYQPNSKAGSKKCRFWQLPETVCARRRTCRIRALLRHFWSKSSQTGRQWEPLTRIRPITPMSRPTSTCGTSPVFTGDLCEMRASRMQWNRCRSSGVEGQCGLAGQCLFEGQGADPGVTGSADLRYG